MTPLMPDDISVVILAGGKGRRMGGRDKGLIHYGDKMLIEHVLEAISKQSANIIINVNRNQPAYSKLGYPVLQDTLADFQGPLAGFLAALSNDKTKAILTLPCDGPYLAQDYLVKMLHALNQQQADIAIAYDGQRMQPVYTLIPAKQKQSLQDFIAEGGRRIDAWFNQLKCTLVDFSGESDMFTNINRPEDLTRGYMKGYEQSE